MSQRTFRSSYSSPTVWPLKSLQLPATLELLPIMLFRTQPRFDSSVSSIFFRADLFFRSNKETAYLFLGWAASDILPFNMPFILVQRVSLGLHLFEVIDSHSAVYVCDFKPAARKLALELGAKEAFDLIELTNKTAAGFTVDTTIDFVANTQSEWSALSTAAFLTALEAFNLAIAALKGNDSRFPSSPKLVLVGFTPENLVLNTLEILSIGGQST
jgi:hypothetical protein